MENDEEYVFIAPRLRVPIEWTAIADQHSMLHTLMAVIRNREQLHYHDIYCVINHMYTKLYKVNNIYWFKKLTEDEQHEIFHH